MLSSQSSSSSSVMFLDVLSCSASTIFSSVTDGFAGTEKIKVILTTSS